MWVLVEIDWLSSNPPYPFSRFSCLGWRSGALAPRVLPQESPRGVAACPSRKPRHLGLCLVHHQAFTPSCLWSPLSSCQRPSLRFEWLWHLFLGMAYWIGLQILVPPQKLPSVDPPCRICCQLKSCRRQLGSTFRFHWSMFSHCRMFLYRWHRRRW